jgi:hypothetical protein
MRFVAKRRDFYLHISEKSSNFAAQNAKRHKTARVRADRSVISQT